MVGAAVINRRLKLIKRVRFNKDLKEVEDLMEMGEFALRLSG